MAKVDDDLDLDVEAGGKKGGSKMKSIIIFSVIGVLIIGLSVGLTVMLVGGDKESSAKSKTEKIDESADEEEESEESSAEPTESAYLDLAPAFVVNLSGEDSDIRYLQIKMSIMVEKEADLDIVKKHSPVVRHHLNLLFSSLDFNDIRSREGKDKLTEESLKVIRDALKKASGKPIVKAVFFNSIVGQ